MLILYPDLKCLLYVDLILASEPVEQEGLDKVLKAGGELLVVRPVLLVAATEKKKHCKG